MGVIMSESEEWIPGVNCDWILVHPKHEPVPLIGFRLNTDRSSDKYGPRLKIHYETYWKEDEPISRDTKPITVRYLWFTVNCADEILDPEGGYFALSGAEVAEKVNAILREKTDIILYNEKSIIIGLYSTDHAIIDTIYHGERTIEIWLSTRSLQDIPIGPDGKNIWLPSGIIKPYSTWGEAVWQ